MAKIYLPKRRRNRHWRKGKMKGKRWKLQFFNLISEMTSYCSYCLLFFRSEYQVQPILEGRGLHKGMNTWRWGSLGSISEDCLPCLLPPVRFGVCRFSWVVDEELILIGMWAPMKRSLALVPLNSFELLVSSLNFCFWDAVSITVITSYNFLKLKQGREPTFIKADYSI